MTPPKGNFTLAQAAEQWIAMIQSPETKATPEQKAALISQITDAAPKAIGSVWGVGAVTLTADTKMAFSEAANAIKAIMRSGK